LRGQAMWDRNAIEVIELRSQLANVYMLQP
jgi:hypothetical protein